MLYPHCPAHPPSILLKHFLRVALSKVIGYNGTTQHLLREESPLNEQKQMLTNSYRNTVNGPKASQNRPR
ncbi:MAG: hypothetical protein FRX49_10236 [Trebouxia sp. A1-2]|nr:MAG: hypothetical protein FRX49_10236 [Trebouxia sp. A1-2]